LFELLMVRLRDPDDNVRFHALRIVEDFSTAAIAQEPSKEVKERVRSISN
jgi:hypothetical protein